MTRLAAGGQRAYFPSMVVPIMVPDSMPMKIVIAVIAAVALFFFIRAYIRNGRL